MNEGTGIPMAKRSRRAAWASITEIEKGSCYRIRFWSSGPDGYRRRSKTVRGTRLDAERVRSELMLEHSDDAPCPTVGQAWERWALPDLERRVSEGDVAASSVRQYRNWWGKHVEPRWGAVQCDAVRPLEVQQWLSSLTLSQASNAMLVCKKVMDYAVRYGLCQTNPFREKYLMPGKSTVERRDAGIWTLPELGEVWRTLHGTWMEPAFILSAFGSCRVGESLAPLASDVELRNVDGVPVAVVEISAQVEHHGNGLDDRMKTTDSTRSVVIAGRAALRLAEIAAGLPPDWPLTNDGMGNHVTQNRYTDNWRKLGMAHPFRNLRNSWQTWMRWDMRVAPHFIEPLMGHKLKGTTGQFYDRPPIDVFCEVVADAYRARPYDAGWDEMGLGER